MFVLSRFLAHSLTTRQPASWLLATPLLLTLPSTYLGTHSTLDQTNRDHLPHLPTRPPARPPTCSPFFVGSFVRCWASNRLGGGEATRWRRVTTTMSGGGSGGGGEKRRGVVCSGNGGIEVAHACKRTVAHGPADSVVFEDAFDACEVGDRRFGHEKVAAPRRFTAQSWWCASTICAEAGDTLGCAFQTGDRNIFNEAVVHVDTARVVGVSQVWPASLGQVTTHQGLTAKDVRWLAHHLPPPPPPPPPPAPGDECAIALGLSQLFSGFQ